MDRDETEDRIRERCRAERWAAATTAAIEGYGDEVLGYLVAVTHDETLAADAFSLWAEHLWKGIAGFRWESTVRTWCYAIARRAVDRIRRDPHRRRAVPLEDPELEALVEDVRSRTATFLQTESRDRVARIRATLDADDQTLLILRVNRKLGWRDVARALLPEGEDSSIVALDRHAAALRKRFERLKLELKARAAAEP